MMAAGGHPAASVMDQYHQLMAHFLATERAVMMGFFGQPQAEPTAGLPMPQPMMQPAPMPAPAAYAPAPAVMPMPMPMPQAPMAPAPASPVPAAPAPAPAPIPAPAAPAVAEPAAPAVAEAPAPAAEPAAAGTATRSVGDELLAVVADRTGYPPEMLNLDAEMEADLGIDSIKRVEIAGAMLEILDLSEDDIDQEELIGARSLREAIAVLEGAAGGGGSAPFE
jgi:acyl carrier protein